MARHRRHRHAAIRYRPRDDLRGAGWRQIVKTPTFALGLAVVAAAVLAFGTTQTYLRFSGSGPGGCAASGCADPAATPGARPGGPGGGTAARGRDPGVQVGYRTLASWATGFTGELTISNRSHGELARWRLAITYRDSRITDMSGADWRPRDGRSSGTIEPGALAGPLRPGRRVRITYTATGTPHAPAGCDFDGARCHIGSSPA